MHFKQSLFLEWISNVTNKIDERNTLLENNIYIYILYIYIYIYIHIFQNSAVLLIDKATKNFDIACKRFYASVIDQRVRVI